MAVTIDLQKRYDRFSLDLKINSQASRIGILGASGCGKSMTLKCIAGIVTPDAGKIAINDKILYDFSNHINIRPQKRHIGYLFQNYALFPTMTVEENIAAGLTGKKEKIRNRVREMVEQFGLQGMEKHLPQQLSGGQQQRVALARILAYEPEVILLDEPFSAMDQYLKDRLQQELFQKLEKYQGILILVSHNRDEIYRFSDEICVIDSGSVIECGKTRQVFRAPKRMETARLTGCKNISRVKRLTKGEYEAIDWRIRLTVDEESFGDRADQIRYVGIRAHDLIPHWEEKRAERINKSEKDSNEDSNEDSDESRNESRKGSNENQGAGIFPIGGIKEAQLPFEKQFYLALPNQMTEHPSSQEEFCWFVQRENLELIDRLGIPQSLILPKEKLIWME